MKKNKIQLTITKTFYVPEGTNIEEHPEGHGIHLVNKKLGFDYYPEIELFVLRKEYFKGKKGMSYYTLDAIKDQEELQKTYWFNEGETTYNMKKDKKEVNFHVESD